MDADHGIAGELFSPDQLGYQRRPTAPPACRHLGPCTIRAWGARGWNRQPLLCSRPRGHDGNHQNADAKGPRAEWRPDGEIVWEAKPL